MDNLFRGNRFRYTAIQSIYDLKISVTGIRQTTIYEHRSILVYNQRTSSYSNHGDHVCLGNK
ncbi:hypothetical protein [Pseudalkalibacillus decolorationis]|uniref:hypothetical protein n=1 Tax=Pseudalkalibacillus decolorationis TaxID=163879 RepID=UPI00214934B1|nr:hypothetical protein [Pseudalkalibacillus decolorationis]